MMAFLKRLFCRHRETTFKMNLHGDMIIQWGWKRSIWVCNRCGEWVGKEELHDE